MSRVVTSLLIAMSSLLMSGGNLASAATDDVKALIIYVTEDGEVSPMVKKLDLFVSHFTDDIAVQSVTNLAPTHMLDVTHIFIFGETSGEFNEDALELLNDFSGLLIGIGESLGQLKRFSGMDSPERMRLTGIRGSYDSEITSLGHSLEAFYTEVAPTDVLLTGFQGEFSFPLLFQVDSSTYYFASQTLEGILGNFLQDALHDILPNNHAAERSAYLRIEDIHPLTDPAQIRAVGAYLDEQDIPYVLAVTPVSVVQETGEEIDLSSAPELVEVLQTLQNRGGTIIAHGYKGQYRNTTPTDGVEFWDTLQNQFITGDSVDEVEPLLTQAHFPSETDFLVYLTEKQAAEAHFIETRLTDAIHALVRYDLYPVAFAAPNNALSEQGYQIVGDYFSSIFGKVQLSDRDWKIASSVPNVTTASFMDSLVVYPETISYVDLTVVNPIQQIKQDVVQAEIVRDGVLGVSFHAYLDVAYLEELLESLTVVEGVQWLDLKRTVQTVNTDNVQITQDGSGEIVVANDMTWLDEIVQKRQNTVLENILWLVTILVGVFVLLFLSFTLYLRAGLKKKLFEERSSNG